MRWGRGQRQWYGGTQLAALGVATPTMALTGLSRPLRYRHAGLEAVAGSWHARAGVWAHR